MVWYVQYGEWVSKIDLTDTNVVPVILKGLKLCVKWADNQIEPYLRFDSKHLLICTLHRMDRSQMIEKAIESKKLKPRSTEVVSHPDCIILSSK
jgi:hypothetical protein